MDGRIGTGSRTMADLIPLATARQGGKPALKHKVDGEWVEVSYQQLEGTVRELALGLVDLGVEPGDRVSILSHTRPSGIADKLDDALPPGSAGVIAVYEHADADAVDKALANAVRKATAQIDKASAKELKEGLQEASAGLGG